MMYGGMVVQLHTCTVLHTSQEQRRHAAEQPRSRPDEQSKQSRTRMAHNTHSVALLTAEQSRAPSHSTAPRSRAKQELEATRPTHPDANPCPSPPTPSAPYEVGHGFAGHRSRGIRGASEGYPRTRSPPQGRHPHHRDLARDSCDWAGAP